VGVEITISEKRNIRVTCTLRNSFNQLPRRRQISCPGGDKPVAQAATNQLPWRRQTSCPGGDKSVALAATTETSCPGGDKSVALAANIEISKYL
jgi:hypothetical protein